MKNMNSLVGITLTGLFLTLNVFSAPKITTIVTKFNGLPIYALTPQATPETLNTLANSICVFMGHKRSDRFKQSQVIQSPITMAVFGTDEEMNVVATEGVITDDQRTSFDYITCIK